MEIRALTPSEQKCGVGYQLDFYRVTADTHRHTCGNNPFYLDFC